MVLVTSGTVSQRVRYPSLVVIAANSYLAETRAMKIGILFYEGADLLDTGGPYEVFLTASRLVERDGDPAPFEVLPITLDAKPVTSYGGLGLVPSMSLEAALPLDVLVVPGTIDLTGPLADNNLIAALAAAAAEPDTLVASVCTGAFLLGEAGVLENRAWTTHWEDIDLLAERLGSAGPATQVPWVDSGDVVTSGGLSAGIAMALHLVDRLVDRSLAEATARQLEYSWDPEAGTST